MSNRKEEYMMVRIDIDDSEFIDRLAYLMSKSTQYLDIKLGINLDASATLQLGTYISDVEDNVSTEATAFKECKLTDLQLLERLKEKREDV